MSAVDGVVVFLDLLSAANASRILHEICWNQTYDCVFLDDVPWRLEFLLLSRAMGVPAVVSTHTDMTHMKSCTGIVKLTWYVHILGTWLAAVHATVSQVFARQLAQTYRVPVGAVWPAILWAPEFKEEPSLWIDRASTQRHQWLKLLKEQGCVPKAILLFAGRWSAEKRIHLLLDAVPSDCALVIVGDSDREDYAKMLLNAGPASGRRNVLSLRKMLGAQELRVAYAASDLFLSASNFETLGNTVVESFCSGTPVAVQPAQGHLEFIEDQKNSWFVNFDDQSEAKATLQRIVASGLDHDSLKVVLPDFEATGAKFRKSDFAREVERALIAPALELGRQHHLEHGLRGFLELAKRFCAFASCFILWFVLRVITRIGFTLLKEPKFEVLGPLGSVVDDAKATSTWTYPCLRALLAVPDLLLFLRKTQTSKGD